jgi:hypothetical protein
MVGLVGSLLELIFFFALRYLNLKKGVKCSKPVPKTQMAYDRRRRMATKAPHIVVTLVLFYSCCDLIV